MSDAIAKPTARRYEIRGLMQGVGYRHVIRGAAMACGIEGWLRHGAQGVLEVHAQGSTEQLQRFRAMLEGDSAYARGLHIEDSNATFEACDGFQIRQ